ncbi:MAG TPA: helix-turn-helix domain-containing protein [Bacteroidales bacterium]|nr:helix-turn-helix domain-containing protein [Bacteroidales bacterium]
MELQLLLNDFPDLSITVKSKDLLAFAELIANQTAEKILANKTEKVFTREEVVIKFNICAATLWRWTKYGHLKSKKIGGRVYYSESEVEKLIRK